MRVGLNHEGVRQECLHASVAGGRVEVCLRTQGEEVRVDVTMNGEEMFEHLTLRELAARLLRKGGGR